jgi:NAD-reducing hydrogenase large subunit
MTATDAKTRRIVIDPVTRIEGHAKITVNLDESGEVTEGRFHVAEFRGFEKFCEGRPFTEMAGITSRVCGICPVSHLIASVKAGDEIMAVAIPPAAEKLRRMMNLAQILQSHALSFFHLSAPDLLLGFDSEPGTRNVFGLAAVNPDLARGGIRLRQFGQEIIEALGGRKIHPAWTTPGGVRGPLTEEECERIRAKLDEAHSTALGALEFFKPLVAKFGEEASIFGNFPTLFMGLVADDGTWENYGGRLRFVDHNRQIVADKLNPANYRDFIGESVEPWSYLKSPYYKPLGYPDGIYRVGPMARLNLCERMGTPLADRELAEYRDRGADACTSSFYYHYARLIEILTCVERIAELVDDSDIRSAEFRARAGVNRLEGVGCSEAPRGTLFHHYQVDKFGIIQRVNLIIATGQNNLAMNRTVTQIAKHYIHDGRAAEGVLNRLEAGIRAFDPCLSCSTHAVGQMPLVLEVVDSAGRLVSRTEREGL